MPARDISTSHLEPARAHEARQAEEGLAEAARTWSVAPKEHVGAVELPGDAAAARAFDAFYDARRQLAHHVGGEAAAEVADGALAAAFTEARGSAS
jgi:hypothetical protein